MTDLTKTNTHSFLMIASLHIKHILRILLATNVLLWSRISFGIIYSFCQAVTWHFLLPFGIQHHLQSLLGRTELC